MKITKEIRPKYLLSEFQYDKKTGVYFPPAKGKMATNFDYSDGKKNETYILSAIKNSKDISVDSEELMRLVKDWPSYYHLGVGRSNILKWLNIPHNANILEFGSGCGAITRYLGENFNSVDSIEGSPLRAQITRERCRDLKNVRVFCSNFEDIKFSSSYDVVTLIGVLEYAPKYFTDRQNPKESCLSLLRLVKTAMKETGLLIIAIENKIGIKYWSGCPEDHTGIIFDGINGYPIDKSPMTCSKKELETLLKDVGLPYFSFYYCFPDYKFATTIISDVEDEKNFYLHNWIKIPFPSYSIPRIYTFHEALAIKTISEAGLLKEFANSFLIIASQGDSSIIPYPDWVVKSFSLARNKELHCVTTLKIKPNTYIEKKRLSGSDEEYAVANNIIKIKHKVFNSPWHKGDLMIFDFFRRIFDRDFKNKILELLKIYYQELINRYYTGICDEQGYPLLRGDSIDFIPRNIIKDNENLYSIDSEWCVTDNIPADYVMYRCLLYDVIRLQIHWIGKKIKNKDGFIIELMRNFFPKYGKSRLAKNEQLEISFQALISEDVEQRTSSLINKKAISKNKIVWKIIKWIWDRLPENIKLKIKKFID
jgi:2-polyprenyl-3-methyl-5-hydroxy-6-metoxy-1,4-benzoquinol methylase